MFELPFATNRYFNEPMTEKDHLSRLLMKRFLSFIEKIEKSGKSALTALLKIVKNDVRTCTGSNLRRIMLLAGRNSTLDLHGADTQYHKIPECEEWRINS